MNDWLLLPFHWSVTMFLELFNYFNCVYRVCWKIDFIDINYGWLRYRYNRWKHIDWDDGDDFRWWLNFPNEKLNAIETISRLFLSFSLVFYYYFICCCCFSFFFLGFISRVGFLGFIGGTVRPRSVTRAKFLRRLMFVSGKVPLDFWLYLQPLSLPQLRWSKATNQRRFYCCLLLQFIQIIRIDEML